MGKSSDEIQKLITAEKQKQLEYYAYTIMHDDNMTTKEKKKRIFQLSSDHAEELYKKHKVLQRKESIYKWKKKNIEKIEKTYIIPQDSLYIYGIAILMMVWHHFFGFPERFGGDLRYIGGNIEYTIELYLGYFGRLCIAMYAFISGYGMMAKSMQKNLKFTEDIKLAIKQIIKFFIRYWIVFIIFVSIGFKFMGLKFEPEEFIKNFIGKSCSYNAEWWYVAYYVKMLIMYPVIKLIVNKLNFIKNSKWIIFALAIILGIINTVFKENYTYYLCFLFGMLIYENRLYEKFNANYAMNDFIQLLYL